MITANQILCHLIGDYLFQNSWMALNKTSKWFAAAVHAFIYSLAFIFLTQSPYALLFIFGTHCVVDRFRLPRYFIWVINGRPEGGLENGYSPNLPPWLSTWLLIIVDNTFHMLLNGTAIYFF